MRTPNPVSLGRFPRVLIVLFVIAIVLVVATLLLRPFWYFEVINNDEVGIKIEAGQIAGIEQPGIASDVGLFVQLIKIKTSAVAILVDDPELITSDKQRIGLEVTADVFRPREGDIVTANYARYKNVYINDADLEKRME